MDTDLILLAGCSTNTTITAHESSLIPPEASVIHVSADPWQVGKNAQADAAIVGDPGAVLGEMAQVLEDEIDAEERTRRVTRTQEYADRTQEDAVSSTTDSPLASKATFVDELRKVAPDALLVDESITTKYVLLDRWPLEPEQFLSTKGGGLGYGLPSAVGAALAESLRPTPKEVVGVIGDGSFLYYPHALYTAARYDIDLTVVIPDNRGYSVLKKNTVDILGGDAADYDFTNMGLNMEPTVDVLQMAESQGIPQWQVEDPDGIASTVQEALDVSGPSLVDVPVHD